MRLRKKELLKYKSQSEQPKELKETNNYEDDHFNKTTFKRTKPKFNLSKLPNLILLITTAMIVLTVGSQIVSEQQSINGTNSTEYTTTELTTINSLAAMSDWFEILGLVIAATLVIGILWAYLGGMMRET